MSLSIQLILIISSRCKTILPFNNERSIEKCRTCLRWKSLLNYVSRMFPCKIYTTLHSTVNLINVKLSRFTFDFGNECHHVKEMFDYLMLPFAFSIVTTFMESQSFFFLKLFERKEVFPLINPSPGCTNSKQKLNRKKLRCESLRHKPKGYYSSFHKCNKSVRLSFFVQSSSPFKFNIFIQLTERGI